MIIICCNRFSSCLFSSHASVITEMGREDKFSHPYEIHLIWLLNLIITIQHFQVVGFRFYLIFTMSRVWDILTGSTRPLLISHYDNIFRVNEMDDRTKLVDVTCLKCNYSAAEFIFVTGCAIQLLLSDLGLLLSVCVAFCNDKLRHSSFEFSYWVIGVSRCSLLAASLLLLL